MKLSILLIFTFIGHSISAQEQRDTIHSKCTTVIAVGGLNIRAKPDKMSKVLGKIPFGGNVKYLSKYAFATDTIRDYPQLYSQYKGAGDFLFTGRWAKIKYKNIVGYVLDTYLYYDDQVDEALKMDSGNYAVLYPYTACYTNMYTPTEFHWYGMYKNKKSTFFFKKVKINYFSKENDAFGGKDFGVSAGNDQGLMVIVGSKKPMKEGPRNAVDINEMRLENPNIEAQMKIYGIEKVYPQKNKPDLYEYVIKANNTSQQLALLIPNRKGYPFTAIQFIGDIDGDGKLDYILENEGEMGHKVLFLTSEKKGTDIVAPVAVCYTYYCC
jgi:hypothetical protein